MTYRVAVLGFGSSGRRMLELIRGRLDEAEFMVYSRSAHQINGVEVTSDLRRVSAFQPDVAVVAGAASDRLAMVKALPDTTRGVLLEKPLATTYAEGAELSRLLQDRGQLCQVGYNLRFAQSLKHFRAAVTSEELGRVVSVRAETGQYLPDWRPDRDYRTTVSAQRSLGGGVLRELSHELDYLQWIFGDIEWVSAWTGQQSQLDMDVDDVAHICCGFSSSSGERGAVGQIDLDFVRHDRVRTVTAICERGSLMWDGMAMEAKRWERGEQDWRVVYSEGGQGVSTYELQWDSFYAAAQDSESPAVSVTDGLKVLAVIEAIEESHQATGQSVYVNLPGAQK